MQHRTEREPGVARSALTPGYVDESLRDNSAAKSFPRPVTPEGFFNSARGLHPGRRCRQGFPGVLLVLLLAVLLASVASAEEPQEDGGLRVLYILTTSVYLDGGTASGIEKGDRFEVVREGEPVAELEVVHVASNTASCRIVELRSDLVVGDQVVPLLAGAVAPASAEVVSTGRATEGKRRGRRAKRVGPAVDVPIGASARVGNGGKNTSAATSQAPVVTQTWREQQAGSVEKLPWADFSGTISARWHHFGDGTEAGRDFDQNTVQLNLRMREIAGTPFEVRVRMRGRENRRVRISGPAEVDRRDRLYELSLSYEPPDGRLSFQVGRLRSGPLVGFDYLDGVLGEYKFARKPKRWMSVGGFYGTRSDIDEIGFVSNGESYGAFFHYKKKRSRDNPFYAEVLLGGIGEYDDIGDVSREYLSIYTRMGSGSRWSLYQRAEVDFNRDWRRDLTGESYQFSNLLLAGTYRFSESFRMGVSYDQRRRYRDFDNRDTPEQFFDDQLRDGLRVTLYLGDPRGWRASTSLGVRRLQSTGEDTTTVNGSIYNSDIAGKDILLGLDFSSYSGPTSNGYRVAVRSRKYFKRGHDIGLLVGISETTSGVLGETRENQWVRLTGTVRLPKGFFVLWELEQSEGDDFEGLRSILQLGFRF